ncbi:MAG: transglutaminase family protein, partial [Marmoricola sp.]|nr:transglutaminase family protein [Marmoricola sp.]
MSVKVSLEHRTSYTFAHAVNVSPHVVRLRPAPHARTPIEAYSLQIEPKNHFLNWQQDPFGNWLARIVFPEKVTKLEINVGVIADLMVINPFDFFVEEYAETFPFAYEAGLAADLAPYFAPVGDSTAVAAWREELNLPQHELSTTDFLVAVNSAVNAAVGYSVRMEPGVQTPDHTLDRAIGSCRDSAWLLVAVLRQFGLAARFVSGYLVQLAADEESLDGPSGPKEVFTDLHAWTEVFVPGAGWVGLDPTSALFAGEGHIPLSATPHPSSAAPIEGLTDPVEVTFGFSNVVRRIHEDPRVTKPYTDEQWQRVDALGAAIDERLLDGDVRLTMGGEPTFVALDDMTSPQWNTDADGENKRELAGTLAAALQQAYAAGGIVHRGQGKWYPGEPLPRWNIALQWLKDGTALWNDPALFADPWDASRAVDDAPARAAALAAEVTRLLGLPAEQLLAAYEDPFAVVAAEAQRPDGSPPEHDPKGRNASRQLLTNSDRGLNAPTGHVLPLTTGEDGWTSPTWRFRRGRLVLLGGTSPVGLRLPLDAISWSDPKEPGEPSYLVAGPPITAGIPQVEVVGTEDAHGAAQTTALTFEGRDGFVHVFLPPTTLLTDYAALLAVVEDAARALEQPLVIEGYGPPPDPRMVQLVVTPDPGVIEVNVQPTSSWAEQRDLTTGLYDLARRTRLTTEKFDLDGTHTGTGGGNHITLGGAEPAESPLLRRPDLLVSMVSYWQRHPSLSYLFSGRFIGPTSQAPRFDEGRPEAVYEMEIAFAEIARMTAEQASNGQSPRPWLVDRALRHLLTDLTGNTHRAEFCVDKMYSPDSSRGRLGLLELRGFEMPPHPQMALLQALLVRSLVAMFWEKPLTAPLVRWGTALHEDFLLPQGATRDINEVVADLRAFGIDVQEAWLDPFTEFRFPRIGFTRLESGIELELRQAIEPWHVLGEEATA